MDIKVTGQGNQHIHTLEPPSQFAHFAGSPAALGVKIWGYRASALQLTFRLVVLKTRGDTAWLPIENDDIRDREVWTGVYRHWYRKASDKAPTTGRLYHHLAIPARPDPLQQLYYDTKSFIFDIFICHFFFI